MWSSVIHYLFIVYSTFTHLFIYSVHSPEAPRHRYPAQQGHSQRQEQRSGTDLGLGSGLGLGAGDAIKD